jgi:hypothetical protein
MRRAWFAVAIVALALPGPAGSSGAATPRARALRLLETGDVAGAAAAAAVLDSLLAEDPTDAPAAYWAARAVEEEGSIEAARRRYLLLEGVIPGTPEARLAEWRRRALERRAADALAARGPDRLEGDAGRGARDSVLFLPPENLGPPDDAPLFGLAWTYLLHEALRGSEVSPVSMPVALAAADLLRYGKAIRAPAAVSTAPVNTVEGLRARLSILPGADGDPYLGRPGSGSGDDLDGALLRFQRDNGLPPTGEADLATQSRLEEVLLAWLQQLPPPVDPRLVARMAELCGASTVVRGTWRRGDGRISVEMSPLDAHGASRFGEPVTAVFAEGDAPAAAREAASRLASRLGGGDLAPAAAWSLTPPELEQAAGTLLLLDRGWARPSLERWRRAPLSWFAWPALASARDAAGLDPEEAAAAEKGLRDAWLRSPGLDGRAALDGLMNGLGLPLGPGDGARGVPSPWRVIGGEGILVIHGERK